MSQTVKEIYVGSTKVFPDTLGAAPTASMVTDVSQLPVAGGNVLLTATGTGDSPFEYQFQSSPAGTNTWTTIRGFDASNTFTDTGVAAATDYRCQVRDKFGRNSGSSAIVSVTIKSLPTVSITPGDTTIPTGGAVEYTATAAGQTSLQWEEDVGAGWVAVAGETAATYSRAASTNGDKVRCVAIDNINPNQASNVSTITVKAVPTISIAPTSFAGYSDATLTFTATATGHTSLQWQTDTGSGWTNISGATSTTYTVPTPIVNGHQFRCVAIDGINPNVGSNAVTATVWANPTVSIAPTSFAGYAGATQLFTATPGGGSGTYTYQWKVDGVDVGGATQSTYTHTVAGNVSVTCAVASNGKSATSNAAAVTQWAAVAVTIAPVNPSVTEGDVINFTATPTGGDGTYTYQWLLDGVAISGATAATYARTTVAADNGKVITCTATSAGQSVTSAGSTMTVATASYWVYADFGNTSAMRGIVGYSTFTAVSFGGSGGPNYFNQYWCSTISIPEIDGAAAISIKGSVTLSYTGRDHTPLILSQPPGGSGQAYGSDTVVLWAGDPASVSPQPIDIAPAITAGHQEIVFNLYSNAGATAQLVSWDNMEIGPA